MNVRVDGQLTFHAVTQILAAALAGYGLAYLPEDLVQPYVTQGRLRRMLEDWCLPFAGYQLFYPSRRPTSPAFEVVAALRRHDP